MLTCWKCKKEWKVAEYFHGIKTWWPKLSTLQHVCEDCGYREELQVEPGKIILGYLYAAGTAHFAGMEDIPVPGLEVELGVDHCFLALNGETWWITGKS